MRGEPRLAMMTAQPSDRRQPRRIMDDRSSSMLELQLLGIEQMDLEARGAVVAR